MFAEATVIWNFFSTKTADSNTKPALLAEDRFREESIGKGKQFIYLFAAAAAAAAAIF